MKQSYNQNSIDLILFYILLFLNSFLIGYAFNIKNLILIMVFILFLILILIKINGINKLKESEEIFNNFSINKLTGSFNETSPKYFDARVKSEKGILLIHGFSASTNEFNHLTKKLEQENIPYFAPLLSGFGSNNFNLLKVVKPEDWLRDVFNGYYLLSQSCKKVDVIGHSMGALLALFLAKENSIENMILTSPYIFVKNNHFIFRKILTIPVLSEIFSVIKPTVTKSSTRRNEKKSYLNSRFVYNSVPVNALRTLWQLTNQIQFNSFKYNKLFIMLGKNDNTINIEKIIVDFIKYGLSNETYFFDKSGHNILEDIEYEIVVDKIIKLIKQNSVL